jgi:heme/copper-type cytochrome/quinol oxidase subunit 3
MTKRAQIGMAMFLIAEGVFFFLLILACVYFRALPIFANASGWVLTALLLGGSLCVWRGWRWAALALGAAFLVGPFVSKFSMLIAVHWLFVLAGVVAIAAVPASAIRTMALYWYFFTTVWVVIFVVASQA